MRRRLTIAVLALLAACNQTKAPPPSDPAAYKVKLAVEPAGDGPVQRLILPAQALIAVQRKDLGDLRLFDGRGKPVPLALEAGNAETSATVNLPGIPVMQYNKDSAVPHILTIEPDGTAYLRPMGRTVSPSDKPELVATIIDTRAIADPVSAITLDAELPLQQPITVTLSSGSDLLDWQPIAEKVLFKGGQGGQMLGSSRIALDGQSLKGRYLQITWGKASGFTIRGAAVTTGKSAPLPSPVVEGQGLMLEDAHRALFSVPFASPLSAIRLTESANDGVVPLRLYARNSAEEQWNLIAAGTLRQDPKGSLIDLGGASWRDYRIEADARSAGLSAAPKIELLLQPVELLAALNQSPPYVLALGSPGAEPAWFERHEIAPDDTPGINNLPLARIDTSGTPPPQIRLEPDIEGAFDLRKAALWAALVLGTLVLALAAIRLGRSGAKTVSE